MSNKAFSLIFGLALTIPVASLLANEAEIELNSLGSSIGSVTATDSEDGLVLVPDLQDLGPGYHRLNIHVSSNCEPGDIKGKIRTASARCGKDGSDVPALPIASLVEQDCSALHERHASKKSR